MLKIGIIGTGVIANEHATSIQKDPELTLAAVSEIDEAKGRAFATERACAFYTDYHAMLQKEDLNVVVVCLPHHLHYSAGMAVLESGRHLFMEKPMANSVRECDELIQKAQAKKVLLMVGQTHQYQPALRKARSLMDEGRIGKLNLIVDAIILYYNWENRKPWFLDPKQSGGGPLVNTGPHQLDHLLYLAQSRPVYVKAAVKNNREGVAVESDLMAYIEFENGIAATFLLCQGYVPTAKEILVRLIGTRGMMEINPWGNVQLAVGNETQEIVCDPPNGVEQEWKEMAAAVKENRRPQTDGEYGKQVVALIHAIYQSARDGEAVRL
jgi:predicted dehydrogenase